jgi:hypothetical protein
MKFLVVSLLKNNIYLFWLPQFQIRAKMSLFHFSEVRRNSNKCQRKQTDDSGIQIFHSKYSSNRTM